MPQTSFLCGFANAVKRSSPIFRTIQKESVLAIIVFVYLLNSVIYFRGYFLIHLALAALFAAAEYMVFRKTKKIVNSVDLSDVPDDEPFLRIALTDTEYDL